MRPTRVEATLELNSFLQGADERGQATLDIEWRPRPDRDWFRIQFQQSGAAWSCGWHQDETHEDLGPSHVQVDSDDWTSSYREPAAFTDPNPMAILETCLEELRARIPDLPEGVC